MSFFGKTLSNTYNFTTGYIDPQSEVPESVAQKQYVDDADEVIQTDVDGFPDELKFLDTAEIKQLEAIGTTTISATQWGYLGVQNQSLRTTDNPLFNNISVTGTVDGRDIASDGANLDNLYTTIGLSALTSAEVDQLENIGTNTISETQWSYLGALNQPLSTADVPSFNGLTLNGNLVVTGTVDGRDVSADGYNLDTLYTVIGLSGLTTDEVSQLVNIDGATISSSNWGNVSLLNQAVGSGNAPTFAGLTINGSINVTGTVDGRDVSADGSTLDSINNNFTYKVNGYTETTLIQTGVTGPVNAGRQGMILTYPGLIPTLEASSWNTFVSGGGTKAPSLKDQNVFIGSMWPGSDPANLKFGDYNTHIGYNTELDFNNDVDFNENVIIGHNHLIKTPIHNYVVMGANHTVSGKDSVIIGENIEIISNDVNTGKIISIGKDNIHYYASSILSNTVAIGNVINDYTSGYVTCVGHGNTIGDNVFTGQSLINVVGSFSLCRASSSGIFGHSSSIPDKAYTNTFIIGNNTSAGSANSLVFGNGLTASGAGIFLEANYETSGTGNQVVFESLGPGLIKMASVVSSRRYKENIVPISEGIYDSSDIYKLEPVQFNYKEKSSIEVGFIAEECLGKGALLESLIVWGDGPDAGAEEPRNENGMVVKGFKYNSMCVPMLEELKKLKIAQAGASSAMEELKTEIFDMKSDARRRDEDIAYLKSENNKLRDIIKSIIKKNG